MLFLQGTSFVLRCDTRLRHLPQYVSGRRPQRGKGRALPTTWSVSPEACETRVMLRAAPAITDVPLDLVDNSVFDHVDVAVDLAMTRRRSRPMSRSPGPDI